MKVIALTRGDLTDAKVGKKNPNWRSKACREKSAEAIVPEKKTGKGRTVVSLEYSPEGGQCVESRKPDNGLPAKR